MEMDWETQCVLKQSKDLCLKIIFKHFDPSTTVCSLVSKAGYVLTFPALWVLLEQRTGVLFSSLLPWIPLFPHSLRAWMAGRDRWWYMSSWRYILVQVQARTLWFCLVSERSSNRHRIILDERLLDPGNWPRNSQQQLSLQWWISG